MAADGGDPAHGRILVDAGPRVDSFGRMQVTRALPTALARDAQGRLFIGGNFTTIAGATLNRLVRLTAGQRDDLVDIGSGFDQFFDDIIVHPDG